MNAAIMILGATFFTLGVYAVYEYVFTGTGVLVAGIAALVVGGVFFYCGVVRMIREKRG